MLNVRHVLFPFDFSERCCGAAPFVESVAKRYQAKVTIFSVAAISNLLYATASEGPPIPIDTDAIRDDLQARLDGTLRGNFSGLVAERIAGVGDPAREIVRFTHSQKVDLIMMPSHGYGPFRGLLLGSVTAKVLHDAECPVWTAAHVAGPPPYNHIDCRNVLCAINYTPESAALMKWADGFARDAGAALRFLHVISYVPDGYPMLRNREIGGQTRADVLVDIDKIRDAAGIQAPVCIASGHIPEAIREEARQHDTDLLVIGRGKANEAFGRVRTHTYGIIRRSPCPVLSV